MPIYDKRDPNNWYNTIPVRKAPDPMPPQGTVLDVDHISNGREMIVRIPVLPGHICRKQKDDETYIQLITETHYDPESKQMRNTKVIIGRDFSWYYPGMMIINDTFYDYFDLHGNICNTVFRKQLEQEAREKEEKERKKQEKEHEKKETENRKKEKSIQTIDDLFETEDEAEETTQQQAKKLPEGDTRTVDEIRESLLQKEKQLEEERRALERQKQDLERAWEEVQSIREEKLLLIAEKEKAHVDLLHYILGSHQHIVLEQAKRRPEKYMKLTQIHLINEILQEIRGLLAGSNASKYLHLAAEPQADDLEHHPGTTYGEMDTLLNAYGWAINAYRNNRLYEANEEEAYYEEDEEDEE